MLNANKVRHHFVPVFYLKGFADSGNDDLLWVYSKCAEKVFCEKPQNVGYVKNYHTFENPDGTIDTNTIEDYFCNVWEGPAASIIKAVNAGVLPIDNDRQFFASFLGLSLTRSPNHRENMEQAIAHLAKSITQFSAADPEHFAQALRSYERDMGEKLTEDTEELRHFILEGEYELTARPELYLKMFIAHGIEFGRIIEKMKWVFVRSTARFKFLTSDTPFFFCDPSDQSFFRGGLLGKNVEVSFPISKELALVATWSDTVPEGYFTGNHELVKSINRRSVLAAHRFVYASEKSAALLRLVRKFANTRPSLTVG